MNLDVLIPSLLIAAPIQKLFPPPIVPALEKLLARADSRVEASFAGSSWLCERWGVQAPYPVAAILAQHDGLDTAKDAWLFAEPVHLASDRDRSSLFPASFLELNTVEVAALVDSLNSHFADRQLHFFAPSPERWYVRCEAPEIPQTTPPSVARLGSIVDSQPRSTGKLNWRSLQNESQMLLFGHAVNTTREAQGKPTVSGVWFWGGGISPELNTPEYQCVVTNSALPKQLAFGTGIDVRPLSWDAVQAASGDALLVLDSCAEPAESGDITAWMRELENLDREWFLPILCALGEGTIHRLQLYVPMADGVRAFLTTRRNHLFRFWRSARPLATYA